MTPIFKHYSKHNRSGVALVMTIIILALITIMVLGFADLVRYETVSSSTHQERGRAQFLSQMGVDTVIGVLKRQTANPDLVWASKPGALIIPEDANPKVLSRQVNLHSGYPATGGAAPNSPPTPAAFAPANLNIQTLADQNPPTYLITDQPADPANAQSTQAVKLPLRWVYVREDGQLDFSETPELQTSNPLVGRYAFWADDESSKININTAWKRNPISGGSGVRNPFSSSHPTAVNLGSLNDPDRGVTFDQNMADFVHSQITQSHTYVDLGVLKADSTGYNRFFNSLYEFRRLDQLSNSTNYTRAINAYKFELTHYNHDPDSTFFNEPRIVLTTQRKYAQGRPFIDILKDSSPPAAGKGAGTHTELGSDPGRTASSSIDYVKLNKVVKKIVNYLKREDWPMVKGGGGASSSPSIQKKYYDENSEYRLTQIALNIIDYVRSAESDYLLVEPLRGIISNGETIGGKYYPAGDFVSDIEQGSIRGRNFTYKGITRSLYVTEMGVWVSPTVINDATNPNRDKRFHCKFFVEVHLPEGNGLDELNLTALPLKQGQGSSAATTNLWVYCANVAGGDRIKMADGNNGWWVVTPSSVVGGDPVIKRGKYKTLQFDAYYRPDFTNNTYVRPKSFSSVRFALAMKNATATQIQNGFGPDPGTQRFEVSPISGGRVSCKIDDASVADGDITSMAVDDPMINNVTADWKEAKPRNTFAGLKYGVTRSNPNGYTADGPPEANVSSLGKNTTIVPPQDTDKSGKITSVSMQFAFPKGHEQNLQGMVYSSGELGFIHTGVEVNDLKNTEGVPYRTLRLQPSQHDNNTVPDWALMDLFTAPVDSPPQAASIFTPHSTGVGGRVNINAQVEPFANPSIVAEGSLLQRRLPLVAVLAGAPSESKTNNILSEAKAKIIASNVYNKKWASDSSSRQFGFADAFDSPGEIVEIEGVSDQGEESEAVIRSIGSLITTRGSVFTVYSIGQSLRETRNGDLLIIAEQRNQTTLERYLEIDDNNTIDDYDDDIKSVNFRKVGSRNLTP